MHRMLNISLVSGKVANTTLEEVKLIQRHNIIL